ncbi:MAG: helix-turn-helix transcriptional regulator [Thermoleophilaceae bacterium]
MSDHTQLPEAPGAVDRTVLAARVRAKREGDSLSLRAAAKALGMSASTISRVESGEHLPERDHLLRLARWAGVPLDEVSRRRLNRDVHGPDASTMEAVELHLRADKDLEPDDAEMLVGLMRTAYSRLSQRKA